MVVDSLTRHADGETQQEPHQLEKSSRRRLRFLDNMGNMQEIQSDDEGDHDTRPSAPRPNRKPTGPLPIKQTFLLLFTVLPEVMIHHMLVPLYPYLTRFLLPDPNTNIGYYSGLLQSAYFFPTTAMNAVWGRLSDTIGRKPILITGLCGYGVGALALGLCTSYWTAMLALGLTGTFSGNAVVAKGMIGELTHDEASRAWGYSVYGVVFSAAGIAGTLLGGMLGDASLFEGLPFLQNRPYFVACALGSLLAALGVLITLKALGEANPPTSYTPLSTNTNDDGELEMVQVVDKKRGSWAEDEPSTSSISSTPSSTSSSRESLDTPSLPSKSTSPFIRRNLQTIKTYAQPYTSIISLRTIVPLACYITYALGNSLFHTALPLLGSSMPHQGGFGLSPRYTSLIMASLSFFKLIFKALFTVIHARLGTVTCFRVGTMLLIPGAFIAPVLGGWRVEDMSLEGPVTAPWAGLLIVSAACTGVGEALMYLSTIMLMTDSVDHKNYGLIHGMGGCLAAFVRTLGPATAGALWELGSRNDMPWLVFAFIGCVAVSGLVVSRYIVPAHMTRKESGENVF